MGAGELEVLSDRGYYSGVQIAQCEDSGIHTYVPKPLTSASNKLGLYSKEDFVYERAHDRYRCPAGELLANRGWSKKNGLRIVDYYAGATTCRDCSMRAQCTRSPQSRRIHWWEREDVLDDMQERLERTPEKMQLRRQTVEHPFGTIKVWMGYTHFLTKTLPRVRTEMSLQVLAYNMKRVMNLIGVGPLIEGLGAAWTGPFYADY